MIIKSRIIILITTILEPAMHEVGNYSTLQEKLPVWIGLVVVVVSTLTAHNPKYSW